MVLFFPDRTRDDIRLDTSSLARSLLLSFRSLSFSFSTPDRSSGPFRTRDNVRPPAEWVSAVNYAETSVPSRSTVAGSHLITDAQTEAVERAMHSRENIIAAYRCIRHVARAFVRSFR